MLYLRLISHSVMCLIPHSPIPLSLSFLCLSKVFTCPLVTDMALHVVQAQHGSSVVVVAAFLVLLPAAAQLVLDHLLKRAHGGFELKTCHFLHVHNVRYLLL